MSGSRKDLSAVVDRYRSNSTEAHESTPRPALTDGEAGHATSAFTGLELAYLTGERRLARVATVGGDGAPHVVPVGFTYNPEHDTIDIGGHDFERTKKFRDVARSGRASVVVDDIVSVDPWHVRGVEVRGRAEALEGGRPLIRIHPERIVAWGLDGQAVESRPASRI